MFKKIIVTLLLGVCGFVNAGTGQMVQTVRGDWTIQMYENNEWCPKWMKDVKVTGQGRSMQACAFFRPTEMDFMIIDQEGDMGFIPAMEFVAPQNVIVPPKQENPRAMPSNT